jgi:hypothetical protein
VDRSAGTVRFSRDARTLARLIWTGLSLSPALTTTSPDPIIMADYTPATIRVTRSDVGATDPVIVPVLSAPGTPVYDASWYRQQLVSGAPQSGTPVRGEADRLWVFWRRAGATSGGPMCYYKVLRPGIRVNAGAIAAIDTTSFSVNVAGTPVLPEEVNVQTGQIYFPQSFESQQVTVSYPMPNGQSASETHYVTWQDESGERPVPMQTAVNEGSLDAFASFETVPMADLGGGGAQTSLKMERVWMFWGSTRGTGGDLFYGALAPRIGPDVNISGSVNVKVFNAAAAGVLQGRGSTQARLQAQAALDAEARHPFTVPPVTGRGPFIPAQLRGASFVAGRR